MKIIVLGAAAGGGFPQWNANSAMNRRAFGGETSHPRMTQCSLAVSSNGEDWVLLNASPDIRQQIIATPELHPRAGLRSSPIKAVILTNADVDAMAGLLVLRERQPFDLWATPYVLEVLASNPIFRVLAADVVRRHALPFKSPFRPLPQLSARAYDLGGKPPLYLEEDEGLGGKVGTNIAIQIRDKDDEYGATMSFVPSCANVDAAGGVASANVMFFDGTMYSDDEMIRSGEGTKTARRMGHIPISGADGSIQALDFFRRGHDDNYFIHINNSNPILNRTSEERKAVEAQGWRIAEDGMRIEL
jgi:pyrroloquinoline quinone biosynthesis protein B